MSTKLTSDQCIIRVGKYRKKIQDWSKICDFGYPHKTYISAASFIIGNPCQYKSYKYSTTPICPIHINYILNGDKLQDIRIKSSKSNIVKLSKDDIEYITNNPIHIPIPSPNIETEPIQIVETEPIQIVETKNNEKIKIIYETEPFKYDDIESIYSIIKNDKVIGGYCAKHKVTHQLYELLQNLHIGEPLWI